MAKTRAQKVTLLSEYKAIVAKKNFVVIETDRLPAAVMASLRKLLSEVDAKMYVIKNKVFAKAVEGEGTLSEQSYVGQLSLIEGGRDIATAIKKLEDAKKDAKTAMGLSGMKDEDVAKYVPFTNKFGYVGGKVLNDADVVRLSKLPDRQTMLSILVGTMAAPITSVMSVMNAVPRAFLYALNDLQNKKAK